MVSISEDSASARNPTCPRLTPSSGISLATTHSAPRRIVPSPPKTTISSIPSSSVTGLRERHHGVRQPRIECGQVIGRQRGDNAGRAQALDQSSCCGDRGWSAHVSQHGDAAYRICICTARLAIPLGCRPWSPATAYSVLIARFARSDCSTRFARSGIARFARCDVRWEPPSSSDRDERRSIVARSRCRRLSCRSAARTSRARIALIPPSRTRSGS